MGWAPPTPAPGLPTPAPPALAPPVGAWGNSGATPTEFIPPGLRAGSGTWRFRQSAVLVTLFGLLLAAVAATVAIIAYEHLSAAAALAVVGVMTAGGVIAAARRVPTALWWTIGAVIGGALGHWS
jgi:hypothetical protein